MDSLWTALVLWHSAQASASPPGRSHHRGRTWGRSRGRYLRLSAELLEERARRATILLTSSAAGGDLLATYAVPVKISRQEDGLWRVECPTFQGCFVDDADLSQALADLQDAVRVYIDLYRERGKELPAEIDADASILTLIPIAA